MPNPEIPSAAERHAGARWSRRSVLRASLGLAGASWLAGLAPQAGAAPGSAYLVVVRDGRYAASRRHADALAPRAHRILEARDDLARLWYGGLAAEARRTPLALAGLTTWSDYVVLEGCAAEAGLRAARHELIRDAGGRGGTLVRWQIGGTPT
jgi:hypothetical protein